MAFRDQGLELSLTDMTENDNTIAEKNERVNLCDDPEDLIRICALVIHGQRRLAIGIRFFKTSGAQKKNRRLPGSGS